MQSGRRYPCKLKCRWFKSSYVNKTLVLNYPNSSYLKRESAYVRLSVRGGGGSWFSSSMPHGSSCFMIPMAWDKLSCRNYAYWWLYYNSRYKYHFMTIFWGKKTKKIDLMIPWLWPPEVRYPCVAILLSGYS